MSSGNSTAKARASSDLPRLRGLLAEAGLTEESIGRVAGSEDPTQPLDLHRALRQTAEPGRFNTLMRLLILGQSVSRDDARAALAPIGLDSLASVGLVSCTDDSVRAHVMFFPIADDLWTLRDLDAELTGRQPGADHVLGIGVSTLMLTALTVRRSGERALDLGTGGGVQAFLAARHAASVIGTDTNPRALMLAELGAQMNGLTNVAFRQGSLYDPVAQDRFDLIVANPPFAVSPESKFIYRDSGMRGDSMCEQLISETGDRLAEGGFATVICDWHHQSEDDWRNRPAGWAAKTGCDLWLLEFSNFAPLEYACQWIPPRERGDNEYGRRLDQWLAYYAELGARRFSRGAMILHKRSASRNWMAASQVRLGQTKGYGPQIERIFAAHDLLSSLSDPRQLLDVTLRLAPGHELRHTLVAEGGKWVIREAILRHTSGFDFEGRVDRIVASLLAGCDGTRTLRVVTETLAADLQAPLETVQTAAVDLVGVLMDKAFLEIVGPR